jgi:hypothetical protein
MGRTVWHNWAIGTKKVDFFLDFLLRMLIIAVWDATGAAESGKD